MASASRERETFNMGVSGTFYEFFAGAGMARAGLSAKWTCLFANDIDTKKGASYARNFGGEAKLKVCDVAALTPSDLAGVASLAWASPPCQDVSEAGGHAGLDGTRSGAFWPFWRLMQSFSAAGRAPRMIVIENVTGVLTSHGGKDFGAVCDALTEGGYRFGALVIDASLFVPQSRERVFVVAVDKGVAIPAAIVADKPVRHFIRRRLSPPAVSTIRSGGAFRFRRSATRSSPTLSRTSRRASPGTIQPTPIG
jgi:DNA (cytosine-5)-methyltransferase 1